MSDRHQFQAVKINVFLLVIAWIYAITMFNLSADSNAEPIAVEVALSGEEEETSELEVPSTEEVPAQPPIEQAMSTKENMALEEVITPPSVDVVSAMPVADSSAIQASDARTSTTKEQVGRIRVDSTYQSHPREIFPWLMERGVRVFLFDKQLNLFAEVNKDGLMERPTRQVIGNGIQREATAEVNQFVQPYLPHNTKHAVVWWPDGLWQKIIQPIRAYDAHSAKVSYQVKDEVLAVTIDSVITDQGSIFPAEVVNIK